jgi:DNA-binding PadR family transcriptional regulator
MTGHRGGRGRGRYGYGPPGAGFAPRGRRARRGAVRAAILVLLGEEPRNGYALMQEIEKRSEGAWRPSPGSVYPALAMMEDEGLIKSVEADDQRAYELTDAGRKAVEERGGVAAPWEEAGEDVGDDVFELVHVMRQVGMAVHQITQAATSEQVKQAKEILTEARRSLYGILAEDPEDEAK